MHKLGLDTSPINYESFPYVKVLQDYRLALRENMISCIYLLFLFFKMCLCP